MTRYFHDWRFEIISPQKRKWITPKNAFTEKAARMCGKKSLSLLLVESFWRKTPDKPE